jgi:glycosyltransferase involved in cell wall biosynthesis
VTRRPPRLRVEMILPTLATAGMEVMASRLTRGLASRGHDVGITCIESGGPLADELRGEGYRISLVAAPGLSTNFRARALETWLAKRAPDVVHVHSGAWSKGACAAKRAGVPRVIHTEHGLLDREPWYSGALKRWAARHTDSIAAVSDALRHYLTDDVRIDPRKVATVANGVLTERFAPLPRSGALRDLVGMPGDAPIIGHVAGLKPVKDQRLLIDAFALVNAALPETRLVIVGEGPLRSMLEEQAGALGLAHVVHLIGEVTDPAPLYREFDLFVLCSKAEGTSMSILESMASGVPVVATAVGGTPDVLAGGACGVLVPPGDREALANGITRLLRDPRSRREFGVAGRRRVEERYSEEAMIDAYEALYTTRGLAMPNGTATVERECVG